MFCVSVLSTADGWKADGYPTLNPTLSPTLSPTLNPTLVSNGNNMYRFVQFFIIDQLMSSLWQSPTLNPTSSPTEFVPISPDPTLNPTLSPTLNPTLSPTLNVSIPFGEISSTKYHLLNMYFVSSNLIAHHVAHHVSCLEE